MLCAGPGLGCAVPAAVGTSRPLHRLHTCSLHRTLCVQWTTLRKICCTRLRATVSENCDCALCCDCVSGKCDNRKSEHAPLGPKSTSQSVPIEIREISPRGHTLDARRETCFSLNTNITSPWSNMHQLHIKDTPACKIFLSVGQHNCSSPRKHKTFASVRQKKHVSLTTNNTREPCASHSFAKQKRHGKNHKMKFLHAKFDRNRHNSIFYHLSFPLQNTSQAFVHATSSPKF